jgi:hypothetical protein
MNVVRTFQVESVVRATPPKLKGQVLVTAIGPQESRIQFYTTDKAAPRVGARITSNNAWKED